MSDALRIPVSPQDHVQGPVDAPITLVEYGDFQCPYCYRAHPVIQELQQRLGDRLRFVFRNFPLTEIHSHALHAAVAAESVGAQLGSDAYWRMHDMIYEHQQDSPTALSDHHLADYAAAVGADTTRVTRDLEDDAFVDRIQADFSGGVRSGVNGTPTFYINGTRYDGDWTDVETFAHDLAHHAHPATA
ncbi:MAG: DsbA family protein [Gemmatimonadaceae bacterium]|nr:DsbA family protein [Gemmatimonadaceae bacterium]NUO96054.1 DsbA family protein [Gemmatimonadaceae bacterium]NUP57242.1 DsbA family protein [Gemmatimonadaceae bacterium]NUP69592.1 DsbA family protein [Gemmatimonadaceae bacterium]NUR32561.1 DsbA family protein [Gemmatimonadaceae bacterium]